MHFAKGVLTSDTTALRKISDKTRKMVDLAIDAEEAMALVEPKRKSQPLRYEIVRLLAATGRASSQDICYFTGASSRTLKGLEKSGIVAFSEEEQLRISQPKAVKPGLPLYSMTSKGLHIKRF